MRQQEQLGSTVRSLAPGWIAAFVFAIGISVTLGLAQGNERQKVSRSERDAAGVARSLALAIERYTALLAVRSEALAALVEVKPDISTEQLQHYAARVTNGDSTFRNLALAPDDVVSFVFPLAGNEAVLGVDLSQQSGQSEAVRRVREERRTVLAGPSNLIQGGVGLTSRSPVILLAPESEGGSRYWGMAVLVVDYEAMLKRVGFEEASKSYRVAMRGRDAAGATGEVFHGRPDLFEQSPATARATVPGGSWLVAVRPKSGWAGNNLLTSPIVPLGLVLTLLFSALGWRIASDSVAIRELAMRDPLTRLPNRRHVQRQVQEALSQLGKEVHCGAVLLIDLDDFKPVNDLLGHRIGDEVLRVIAERMRAVTGARDFLARIGGDEFLLVHASPSQHCREDVEATATRLLAAIAQSVLVEDHTIRVRASMGLALFPEHGRDPTILRECADRALYRAKADGGNRALVYVRGDHDIDRSSGNHRALPE